MAFFAIADLHLSYGVDKPMDQFGAQWINHPQKIAENWRRAVGEEDVVLIPGDISWAMRPREAMPDLAFLAELPGRKVLLRGNHDYWWQSIGKVRSILPVGFQAIQNDCLEIDGWAVCGTRGWNIPGSGLPGNDDPKFYQRERERLGLSLRAAPSGLAKIVMLHFPPYLKSLEHRGFTDLLEKHRVAVCVFGHLHGAADHRLAPDGEKGGVRYVFCAADAVDFTPVRLPLP